MYALVTHGGAVAYAIFSLAFGLLPGSGAPEFGFSTPFGSENRISDGAVDRKPQRNGKLDRFCIGFCGALRNT